MKTDQRQPLLLSEANVHDYVNDTVIGHLGLDNARVVEVAEVTDQTYVNWIFRIRIADASGTNTVFLRQTRDHVKSKPDMAMDPGRIAFEVSILGLLGEIVPDTTPTVLYFDAANNVAVLSDIKGRGHLLVDELRAGRAHPQTGTLFGERVAKVHLETQGISHKRVRGNEEENQEAVEFHLGMRLEPAQKLAPSATEQLLQASSEAPTCLVLGDLASKNIFIDDSDVRFLDLERAFVGDPAFDPAFLFCHYLIEIPQAGIGQSLTFIEKFMTSYRQRLGDRLDRPELDSLENRLIRFLGVTLLYRILGFYLVVDVGEDKDAWEHRAKALLADEDSISITEALGRLELT